MKREEYIKPEMQVFLLKSNTPLLAGSPILELDDSDANQVDDELKVL